MKAALDQIKDRLFTEIHTKNLVYNTCWEDPRIDRQLLQFDGESRIVMITSAGCNALDYLLDGPASIDCIDVNPRQNALLALKLALFKHGEYSLLYQMFGNGRHDQAQELYADALRQYLPDYATEFWDKKINYFQPKSEKESFYFRGTAGKFAWLFNQYLQSGKKDREQVDRLLNSQTLEEQEAAYALLEPKVLNKLVKWMMNRHITMSMLGVPRPQQQLIREGYPGGMAGYLSDNLRHVFTRLPISDNYFWHLYLKGRYRKDRCPNYLQPQNFDKLKAHAKAIRQHNMTVAEFLRQNPGKYSHFIMLDHQDWLASHAPEALAEEWELILANSRPGTQVLLRSAAIRIDFLPEFVKKRVKFREEDTAYWHKKDRVGTYGSTCLAVVQ